MTRSRATCGRTCDCSELCPAGETHAGDRAYFAAHEAASGAECDDRADREARW